MMLQPQEGSLPSSEPGHCAWPQSSRCAPPAGEAMTKGVMPVLRGVLGWAGALGREGQRISSHLMCDKHCHQRISAQGAESRGKALWAPQGRWR